MIKVGTKKDNYYPTVPGFKTVIVTTACFKEWKDLSPYYLRTEKGEIIENKWQFSKLYKTVPHSTQRYSRFDKTVIWEHPSETHVDDNNNILPAYYAWRNKGFNNPHAVRYPCGYKHRSNVLTSIDDNGNFYDYIRARFYIYCKIYYDAAIVCPKFHELKQLLNNGVNLLIIEVDGPKQQDLDYYINKYGVPFDFITNNTIDINQQNMDIMLNDPKNSFGHGYVLACMLLNIVPRLYNP